MDRLGIELISAFGLPPVDYVRLAADLGVGRIGIAPAPITDNPHGYAPWNLLEDPRLVRDLKAALREHSVKVVLGEGFLIMPGTDMSDLERLLDLMAELGAPCVNAVSLEQDRPRARDQFARLAGMAAQRGQTLTLEFLPMMWPATLGEALALVTDSGAANGKLLIDAMHLFRSGGSVADLARLDPAMIGHVQLCDVPMPVGASPPSPEQMESYGEEARHERRCPGEGDLPLADFLRALPRDLTVGLEIPMLSKAKAGISPAEALAPCVVAARRLLAEVG
jgi:sugar phosphate isomerase/epimerase